MKLIFIRLDLTTVTGSHLLIDKIGSHFCIPELSCNLICSSKDERKKDIIRKRLATYMISISDASTRQLSSFH